MITTVNPPGGTRDLLAVDLRKRRQVIALIQEVYESFGFEPLETPAFENLATLLGKYGEEGDQLLFRILLRGEKLEQVIASRNLTQNDLSDLALKYDLTVPLARVVARFGSQLPKFYKRYQIQPVWRADRPARGRFREFMQCDLDVCGSSSMVVETEVLAAAGTVMERLGFQDFTILLNHREVLRGLIEAAGLPEAMEGSALVAVDKWDKVGREGVAAELAARGVSPEVASHLLEMLEQAGNLEDNLARLASLRRSLSRPTAVQGLQELQTILELSQETGMARRLVIALRLARGLSYYTGAIFEIVVPGVSGSLGGGGRYDGLVGMFAGRDIPACGFSLGLERIQLLMEERGMFAGSESLVDLLFMHFADTLPDILALATRARRSGCVCDVFVEPAGLKNQFNYAAARQARFVAFHGAREKESGQLRLKRQSDGVEMTVAVARLESELQRLGVASRAAQ